ncbi:MAG: hydrogenase expression/formation protein HypE, partial [Promethearchaeota archaeon]
CGTLNDLIMMGAKPLALTSVIIIEEGTTFTEIGKIIQSFNLITEQANVGVLAGDTKVMPRGTLKGIIMSTSGVGIKLKNKLIADSNCQIGSKIIITGSIGDHGAALIASREGIELETSLKSDVAALSPLVEIVQNTPDILAMKDPTRGGLASALNEWASKSNVGIQINEGSLIIKKEVQAVADILGLDPLEISNEGRAIICIREEHAEECLKKIKNTSIGKDAVIIGNVNDKNRGMVVLRTQLGGSRIIETPMGEPIPRVC